MAQISCRTVLSSSGGPLNWWFAGVTNITMCSNFRVGQIKLLVKLVAPCAAQCS